MTAPAEGFFVVGGTVRPEAPSYVQRAADRELLEHAAAGQFCYVLTPRQMGKSSLMERTAIDLERKNTSCVIIDLQGMIERGMSA
ncbi:MAG: AAA-like domain-containing protein, partial [Gammaproteobacteria bacterium]